VPVRNAEFTRELGRAFHRPAFMPMPAFVLRLLGDLADELLLGGQQVIPDKALESGFEFRHATLRSALAAMLHRDEPRRMAGLRNVSIAASGTKA
jgi:NAD dependent epimerase/dehydratase family enzyme